MLVKGERVRGTDELLKQFPSLIGLRGTVLRKCRVNWPAYAVRWDGRRGEQHIHEKFLEHTES